MKKYKQTAETIDQILQCKNELGSSSWFSKARKQLRSFNFKPGYIRCVAIGEPADLQVKYQIAFLLLLIDEYKCAASVWDPILRKQDFPVFENFEIPVCKSHPAESKQNCLWFAPHAPYFLEPELIELVGTQNLYIGNNMAMYRPDSVRDKKVMEDAVKNWKIEAFKEQKSTPWMQGFINTAIQQKRAVEE